MNLVAALRVAADARSKGVLIVLNDEIHPARDAIKTSTYRLQTFQSPGLGPIGYVDGDGVFFHRTSLRRAGVFAANFTALSRNVWPRVDIIYSYAGSDGALVTAAVAAGARGIISAGFASGIPTPAEQHRLSEARNAGVVVVQCSRASGRVARRRYLDEIGIIPGEDFSPQKARILLTLSLAVGFGPDHSRCLSRLLICASSDLVRV
jgi:L-asparaginase